MNVLVFGARGKIGKLVTQEALGRGHNVTGFVLHPSDKSTHQDNYREFKGDATNEASVRHAMENQDVVISALGHSRHTPMEMQSQAMRNITKAMAEHKIARIVSLTGTGVFASGDNPSLLDRLFVSVLLFLDPKRIQDGIKHVEVLKDSKLDWVVLRTPKHSNRKVHKRYSLQPHLSGGRFSVSRVHIATCMVDMAEATRIEARLPVLGA